MKKQHISREISRGIADNAQKRLTKPGKSAIINTDENKSKEGIAMLLEFSCANHKSIREKVLFSMMASSDDEHPQNLVNFKNNNFLRSAVVYGANGSGKSNFIDAITFVKKLVVKSANNSPDEKIHHPVHKLSAPDEESEYNMQFVTQGVHYSYGFALLNGEVVSEYLYYVPTTRMAKIFTRQGNEITEGDKFKRKFANGHQALKSNRLFLSCISSFCNVEEVERAFNFFAKDLAIYNLNGDNDGLYYALRIMEKRPDLVKAIVDLIDILGTPIKDIYINIEEMAFSDENLALAAARTKENGSSIVYSGNKLCIYDAKMIYENFSIDLIKEESTGIKKLISFFCAVIGAMWNNKVLVCDELDANLHEFVLMAIVALFKSVSAATQAQIIFTTHSTSVLDLDFFRRDQIWFTELRNEEFSTDLYSLIEINNVRKEENVQRGYRSGKYGGIPMLDEEKAKLFFQNVAEKGDL